MHITIIKHNKLNSANITLEKSTCYINPDFIKYIEGHTEYQKQKSFSFFNKDCNLANISGKAIIHLQDKFGVYQLIEITGEFMLNDAIIVAIDNNLTFEAINNFSITKIINNAPSAKIKIIGTGKILIYAKGPIEQITLQHMMHFYKQEILGYTGNIKLSSIVVNFYNHKIRNKTIMHAQGNGLIYITKHDTENIYLLEKMHNV